ncbi:MAG: CHASE4 domain-containing protein [Planctomycetota bacterium]
MITGTALAVFCWAGYEIQNRVVFPGFIMLERDYVVENLQRCVAAIDNEIDHLDGLCHDWAAWDDTVDFVEGRANTYLAANLQPETFANNNLNLIAFFDPHGHRVWGRILAPEGHAFSDVAEFSDPTLPADHPLFGLDTTQPLHEQCVRGVISIKQSPMIVSSRPIVTTQNEGPMKGYIMMGRFLDPTFTTALAEQINVDLRIWPVDDPSIPVKGLSAMKEIDADRSHQIQEESRETLLAYTVIPDIRGKPALLLRTENDRTITLKGSIISRWSGIFMAATGLFILLVIILSVQALVLAPVARLTRHVKEIGKSRDLTGRIAVVSSDEIGTLASEFNHTVLALSDARNKLLEQSYYSGLVEMASGIMHNIRNALTPTVLRIEILRNRFECLPLDKVEAALQELIAGGLPENRVKALQLYVQRGLHSTKILIDNTNQEHVDILKNVMHIEEILSSHELFCQANRALDHQQMEDVVYDATRFMKTKLRDSIHIEVEPGLSELPTVWAERIVLLQVLTNLLNNSAESIIIRARENKKGLIRIKGYVDSQDQNHPVHLEISDNGEGIDPETMKQIFGRGFTTKKKGFTGGIGLHWCGNVISAMNGKIYAESRGAGKGATFHLLIPQSASKKSCSDSPPSLELRRDTPPLAERCHDTPSLSRCEQATDSPKCVPDDTSDASRDRIRA